MRGRVKTGLEAGTSGASSQYQRSHCSAYDPINFDADPDPDPGSALEKNGSGSKSGTRSRLFL